MANPAQNHSYSHTSHYVDLEKFTGYIQKLLSSDERMDAGKKALLKALIVTDLWKEIEQSSYWRHQIFNGGLSGPFTEYFACFNPQWKVDFWGQRVQPIDITYLSQHAIPLAYQATVSNTQEILSKKVNELSLRLAEGQKVQIASLACGTMYDVLGANYEDRTKISFTGYDLDQESLKLVSEKAGHLGYDSEQINLEQCDITNSPLPKKTYDIVVCNGFSFYIGDADLSRLIKNVEKALKPNGTFLMSFIQPPASWRMSDKEKEVNNIVQGIFDAVPMNWSSNLRSVNQVWDLASAEGLTNLSVSWEIHRIHPLFVAHKQES